jgi:hypothetical protein
MLITVNFGLKEKGIAVFLKTLFFLLLREHLKSRHALGKTRLVVVVQPKSERTTTSQEWGLVVPFLKRFDNFSGVHFRKKRMGVRGYEKL